MKKLITMTVLLMMMITTGVLAGEGVYEVQSEDNVGDVTFKIKTDEIVVDRYNYNIIGIKQDGYIKEGRYSPDFANHS